MFKKDQRYSFRKGIPSKSLNAELFNLRYQNNDKGKYVCAFVVGVKVDKRSAVRHKIKRKFANALREILKDKKISYDLVFFVKKASLEKEYSEIKQEILNILTKTGILNN